MGRQPEELTEKEQLRGHEATAFRILAMEGPDRGKKLWVHASNPGPVRVGVSRTCELVLSDRKVSRRQISFECDGGLLRASDLESTNGTLVNGIKIERVLLRGGEIIRVGDTELHVEAIIEAKGG